MGIVVAFLMGGYPADGMLGVIAGPPEPSEGGNGDLEANIAMLTIC
jgi:hypothetical protein